MRAIIPIWCAAVVCVGAGCAGADSDERTRTVFDVVIVPVGAPAALTANDGSTVSLTSAALAIGGLAWFEGEAAIAWRVSDLLSIARASAHPGHYTPGATLADLRPIGVVDLLGGPHAAGTAEGLTGSYGTLSLPLVNNSALGGADGGALSIAGTAVTAAGSLSFLAALPLSHTVEGIPSAFSVAEGGTVTIEIALADLVRRVDFTALAGSTAAVDLVAVAQAKNALERSLESQATYTVRYAGPED